MAENPLVAAMRRGRIRLSIDGYTPQEGTYERGRDSARGYLDTFAPNGAERVANQGIYSLLDLKNYPYFLSAAPVAVAHKWPDFIPWLREKSDASVQGLAEADDLKMRGEDTSPAYYKVGSNALDAASTLPLGGAAFQAAGVGKVPANSVGMFAGARAKTANPEMMAKAEKMLADGVPRERVWAETGHFKGPDGKMRFEIDDKALRVRDGTDFMGRGWFRRGPISHDALQEAYPNLRKHDGHVQTGAGEYAWRGSTGSIFVESADDAGKRQYASHELQHFVQQNEGTEKGGSVKTSAEKYPSEFKREVENILSELSPAGRKDPAAIQSAEELASIRVYKRLAGEVEARAVEKRINMTPEERRARPPWLDYDVPENQQIVRFGDGVAANPANATEENPLVRAMRSMRQRQ